MKHISYHDLCIIMQALDLYTKQMKSMEDENLPIGVLGRTQLHEDIERSIALKKHFSEVGDRLAVIDPDLSVNIVAKFYND